MTQDKELKLVFAPGCFDNFEGTQEELDEMVAQIQAAFESGELFESAREVDMVELEEEYPDVLEALAAADSNKPRNVH